MVNIKKLLFEENEVSSPQDAIHKLRPGDKIQIKTRKKITKFGFTIFDANKKYSARVMQSGDMLINHEEVPFRGTSSKMSKKEFLENLQEEGGELCQDIIFCGESTITRAGVGTFTFDQALAGEEADGRAKGTSGDSAPPEMKGKESGEMAKRPEFTSGDPKTPTLKIIKTPEGNYVLIYAAGNEDPLGKRVEITKDLNSELQKLFGYENWEEYKNDNRDDLTRKLEKKDGKVVSGPTVHPFHVAYGLQEFLITLSAGDYELVGVPDKPLPATKDVPFVGTFWHNIVPHLSPEWKKRLEWLQAESLSLGLDLDAIFTAAAGGAEGAGSVLQGRAGVPWLQDTIDGASEGLKETKEVLLKSGGATDTEEISGAVSPQNLYEGRETGENLFGNHPLNINLAAVSATITTILSLRKQFFGKSGILNLAMSNPIEGLANKDIINRIKSKQNFDSVFASKFSGARPVSFPNRGYWTKGLKPPYITRDEGEAFMINPSGGLAKAALLKEQQETPWWDEFVDDVTNFLDSGWGGTLVKIADPTGLTSWPDVSNAYKKWDANQSWGNSMDLALNVFAAVPIVGRFARPWKAQKLANKAARLGDKARDMKQLARAEVSTLKGSLNTAKNQMRAHDNSIAQLKAMIAHDKAVLSSIPKLSTGGYSAANLAKVSKLQGKIAGSGAQVQVAEKALVGAKKSIASIEKIIVKQEKLYAKGVKVQRRGMKVANRGALANIEKLRFMRRPTWSAIKKRAFTRFTSAMLVQLNMADEAPPPDGGPEGAGGFAPTSGVPLQPDSLQYYLLPKEWRNGVWYTAPEYTLAQRIGANINFSSEKPGVITMPTTSAAGPAAAAAPGALSAATPAGAERDIDLHALIFGHSQADGLGKMHEKALEAKGIKVTRKVYNGRNDKQLAEIISEITAEGDKPYTHVVLHLNGNDWRLPPERGLQAVSEAKEVDKSFPTPRYEEAKRKIVDYAISVLKVPEENIWILLPAHNADKTTAGYSNREASSLRAIEFFRKVYPKANVPDLIYAGNKSFSNKEKSYLSGRSPESISMANQIANKIPGVAAVAKKAPQLKKDIPRTSRPDYSTKGMPTKMRWAVNNAELAMQNHGAFIQRAASKLGVEPGIIAGFIAKEVGGREIRTGDRIKKLFMISSFVKRYKKKFPGRQLPDWAARAYNKRPYNKTDNKPPYSGSDKMFREAYSLDQRIALQSTSWGIAQVHAWSYKSLGYSSEHEMVNDLKNSPEAQMNSLINYVRTKPKLHNAMKRKDWWAIGHYYNGDERGKYGSHVQAVYNAVSGDNDTSYVEESKSEWRRRRRKEAT